MKNKYLGKIGGQALIEGVMMRGVDKYAMSIRLPNGEIDTEISPIAKKSKFSKIPIIRGVLGFIDSLALGYKCLTKSAEKSGFADEADAESKFEKWLLDKCGDKLGGIVATIGAFLGIILAVALFMILPSYLVKLLDSVFPLGGFKALFEGLIKIIIFIAYLALVSHQKDIKRVFQYHGAEHKTIFCFEKELPLTAENAQMQSRFHPRCGTSFIIIILVISILIFSLPIITWDNILLRTVIKLALMPLVMGISYEFLRYAGKHNNFIVKILSAPGLWVQRLTTKEPDLSQLEVAIEALKGALPDECKDEYKQA